MIVEFLVYTIAKLQYPFCSATEVRLCTPSLIIAAPDNFNFDPQPAESTTPEATAQPQAPVIPNKSGQSNVLDPQPAKSTTPEVTAQPQPLVIRDKSGQSNVLPQENKIAAQIAWKYFERNWNSKTGLVNATDNIPWTTWWDAGSALLGINAAKQLNVIDDKLFKTRMNVLLRTLETLSLPKTGLPNKAYSTSTAKMRKLNDTPDPQGKSGWSALDMGRFLLALHVMRSQYPEYTERINSIVARWNLQKLVKNGWLNGGVPGKNGKIREVQEGRFGYEQYAANSLKFWNLNASNALNNPPLKQIQVDGVPLEVDKRDQNNSDATNYLTNDPYLLWGLEIGWNNYILNQVQNILEVQTKRYKRTGILTAVNEDALDRFPYFLYYSIYANGQVWSATNSRGKAYPNFRFLSTKAAFAWFALMPKNEYTKKIRNFAQNFYNKNSGYFSGKYENQKIGNNTSFNVNTNAVVLESLLYAKRNNLKK